MPIGAPNGMIFRWMRHAPSGRVRVCGAGNPKYRLSRRDLSAASSLLGVGEAEQRQPVPLDAFFYYF